MDVDLMLMGEHIRIFDDLEVMLAAAPSAWEEWWFLAKNGHRKKFALFTTYLCMYTKVLRVPRERSI